jgi:hypothetical protein
MPTANSPVDDGARMKVDAFMLFTRLRYNLP